MFTQDTDACNRPTQVLKPRAAALTRLDDNTTRLDVMRDHICTTTILPNPPDELSRIVRYLLSNPSLDRAPIKDGMVLREFDYLVILASISTSNAQSVLVPVTEAARIFSYDT